MNALGLIAIGIGVLAIVIGIRGTHGAVWGALRGAAGGQTGGSATQPRTV